MSLDQNIITQFSKHLFWDVKRENLELEKHKAYIVQRALEYGLLKDWLLIKKIYGLEEITSISQRLRSLEPKALNFIATISETPKESFRCYTLRQSNQRHWFY